MLYRTSVRRNDDATCTTAWSKIILHFKINQILVSVYRLSRFYFNILYSASDIRHCAIQKIKNIEQVILNNEPKAIPSRVYLCTLPLPSPFIKSFTSLRVAWFKSPGMVCLMAEAATPNSAASGMGMPVTKP